VEWHTRLVPDEQAQIEAALKRARGRRRLPACVLTTGGTGPAPRDVTPEATLAVAHRVMPGFGEQMRQISLSFVPTAILSRQVAVIRGACLIINLPGQPKSIAETLQGLPEASPPVHGIFAAVPVLHRPASAARTWRPTRRCAGPSARSPHVRPHSAPERPALLDEPGQAARRRSARCVCASCGTHVARGQFARARRELLDRLPQQRDLVLVAERRCR
jgi:molybdenum cofactor synthesis domain-containing protein